MGNGWLATTQQHCLSPTDRNEAADSWPGWGDRCSLFTQIAPPSRLRAYVQYSPKSYRYAASKQVGMACEVCECVRNERDVRCSCLVVVKQRDCAGQLCCKPRPAGSCLGSRLAVCSAAVPHYNTVQYKQAWQHESYLYQPVS